MEKQFIGCSMLIFGGLTLILVVALLITLPVMILWNLVIPDVTQRALTPISFWQALGISILSSLLFKSSSSSSSKD